MSNPLAVAIPPRTAPAKLKASKSQRSCDVGSHNSEGRRRPQTAYVSYEAVMAIQAMEAKKKAQLRSTRTNDPTNPLRQHNYEKHRERVRTAQAQVDSSCPIVGKCLYSSPTTFNRKVANFSRIERENAILLRRIAAILEGNAIVDNRLKPTTRNINNRGRARQEKLLRTTFENLSLLKRIQEQKATYSRKDQLAEYARREKIMDRLSYYPLFWKIKGPKGWEKYEKMAIENAKTNPKPLVFLDCATEEESLGRIIIELRADIVPMSAENFRRLCTGETESGISYRCSQFSRIIPGILFQGGDVTGQKGLGSTSIYGETFPDENFYLQHDGEGVVSMANYGKNTNGCQFLIDARPLPVLDGVNVVIGKVVAGLDCLKKMMDIVGPTGKTTSVIWIHNCGQLGSADEIETGGEETSELEATDQSEEEASYATEE